MDLDIPNKKDLLCYNKSFIRNRKIIRNRKNFNLFKIDKS